jgi:nitrate/nitrite transport system ATP-binding protein
MTVFLDISRISKRFITDGAVFEALKDVDLLDVTDGGIFLEGSQITEPGPDRAVVFQNHALMPWLDVYGNVELAVNAVFHGRKNDREMDEWIRHNLELVNMTHAMRKMPSEISGGMKQRVGIARARAMQPKVLLMDEPFGALDALTRAQLQESTMDIHRELGNTVIMITHDVDEAVLLSDRIVMMSNGPSARIGEIVEVDLPRPRRRLELAEHPDYNRCRKRGLDFLYSTNKAPSVLQHEARREAKHEAEPQAREEADSKPERAA